MKAFFGGARYRIAIDEMPDTRDVVDLLEGIYIARREGDFNEETNLQESDGYRQKSRLHCFAPRSLYVMYSSTYIHLQETVLRLYRSAESLTRLTGYHLVRNKWEDGEEDGRPGRR